MNISTKLATYSIIIRKLARQILRKAAMQLLYKLKSNYCLIQVLIVLKTHAYQNIIKQIKKAYGKL